MIYSQDYLNEALQFIQNNTQFLRDEDLRGLYEKSVTDTLLDQGVITQLLLDADINPLLYMKNTYPYMFSKVHFATFDYEIPDHIEEITNNTFSRTSGLHNIIISRSINSIQNNAFISCTDLHLLTYKGTTQQWKEIKKSVNWVVACTNLKKIVCTDGNIEI